MQRLSLLRRYSASPLANRKYGVAHGVRLVIRGRARSIARVDELRLLLRLGYKQTRAPDSLAD